MELICATSNEQKFNIGKEILRPFGINLIQTPADVDEIQGEDQKLVLRDKALRAYDVIKKPLVVSDDWWDIPALGGFPGAYMKSMNHWLKPEDFVSLMKGKTDRRIILHAYLAYTDGTNVEIFTGDDSGVIADSPRGIFGPPIMHVASLDCDNGLTISEVYDRGLEHEENRLVMRNDQWIQLANWLMGRE